MRAIPAVVVSLALVGGVTAAAAADAFVITLDQTVSNGIPARGAGNIESPGTSDTYTLTIDATTTVFFDEIAGGCAINWTCVGPGGVTFASNAICAGDPGSKVLATGVYTITVSATGQNTGTYSFKVWTQSEPQQFAIALEQPVSNGVPSAGAGNIEQPGSVDIYTFSIDSPKTVYFDEVGGPCNINWTCAGPSGIVFSNQTVCVTDPGAKLLATPGTYTITVSGSDSAIGPYSFTLWDVEPPQVFTIGTDQVISNGAPGTGAGNLEEPGAVDIYELTIKFPTTVYFDELSGSCAIDWSCLGPAGVVFASQAICANDPGVYALLEVGTYTLTVVSSSGAPGTYSFAVNTVEPPQVFTIAIGDIVADGIPGPGAGNIEGTGAIDVYQFSARAGDELCVDELGGSCAISWQLKAPTGATVIAGNPICVTDPPSAALPASGVYQLTVYGTAGGTGTYSFTTRLRPAVDLDGDCRTNAADIAILLGAWGTCVGCPADVDGSGAVDAADLALLLGAWTG